MATVNYFIAVKKKNSKMASTHVAPPPPKKGVAIDFAGKYSAFSEDYILENSIIHPPRLFDFTANEWKLWTDVKIRESFYVFLSKRNNHEPRRGTLLEHYIRGTCSPKEFHAFVDCYCLSVVWSFMVAERMEGLHWIVADTAKKGTAIKTFYMIPTWMTFIYD